LFHSGSIFTIVSDPSTIQFRQIIRVEISLRFCDSFNNLKLVTARGSWSKNLTALIRGHSHISVTLKGRWGQNFVTLHTK
jgi:hypothetical protein